MFAGELSQPLADSAGKDISHWFNPKAQDIRRWVNQSTGLEEYYTPMGRFVHIPPSDPSDDFGSDFDLPWWKVTFGCPVPLLPLPHNLLSPGPSISRPTALDRDAFAEDTEDTHRQYAHKG